MMFLLRAALLLLAVYVGVCIFLYLRQRDMMYFPTVATSVQMEQAAAATGMERWVGADGTAHGWRTRSGDAMQVPVVIFHGNGGNALNRGDLIERLRTVGVRGRIHVLEYPGFGDRAGAPTQESLVGAARSALASFGGPVVVLGESLGTGVAAQAVDPATTRGLLLITPFDSMVDAAANRYPWVPVHLLVKDRYDSVAALRGTRIPTTVLLAENDETTPPEGGRRLFEALGGPKHLDVVAGAGHNDAIPGLGDAGWRTIAEFVGAVPRD